jgi:four helix bundle protein
VLHEKEHHRDEMMRGGRTPPHTFRAMQVTVPIRGNAPMHGVVKRYRDLVAWQQAMELVVDAYRLSDTFPRDEKYGIVQQLRRAAVSVPSNIAEGHGREHLGDYLRHLSIANGSLMELETQILIAGRMKYVTIDDEKRVLVRTGRVGKLLSGLTRALKARRVEPRET